MRSAIPRRASLAGIVALALVVRLIVIAASPGFQARTDAADYDRDAVSLAVQGTFPPSVLARGGPNAFRPPMFPLALAATYSLSGTGSATARWRAGRVMEALLGALAAGLVALLAAELFGSSAGLAAGTVAALYPPLLLAGSSLMSESLYIPLVLSGFLCALRSRRPGARAARWALAAGALIGLAGLTRSNGLALALPVCLLVWHRRPWRGRQAILLPALSVLGVLVVLVPWTIRNVNRFGELVPVSTESGYALAGTYNPAAQGRRDYPALWIPPVLGVRAALTRAPGLNEAALSDQLDGDALRYIGHHPVAVARTFAWNSLRLLDLTGTGYERWAGRFVDYPVWLIDSSVYAFWIVLVGLVIVGVAHRRRRRLGALVAAIPWPLWLWPALIGLSSIAFIGATRYRVPADPLFLALLGGGIVTLRREERPAAAGGPDGL